MPALPFIQSTNLGNTPYLAPDYSFLQGQVQHANQQYEQGLQQVESDYSAVLTSDVTDQANVQKKGEYVKQFQEGLKKLAGSNLSLPQSQAEAEKIMAPFWQDDKLLKDMSYTKFKKNEIQKGYAALNSTDEDVRKTANQDSIDLMGLQLNNLRSANRSDKAYGELDWDSYTPADNIQQVLEKHKKDDGFEVKMDMRDGSGSIVTVTNGPSSISNYKVYADGILGNQYNKQYNVKGKLAKERQLQTLQQQGYTREQALEQIASPMYETVKGSYEKRLDAFKNTITQKSAELKKLTDQVAKQGGKPIPTQADSIQKLQTELGNFQAMQSQLDTHYKDFTSDSGKRGFYMQPETGLAQMYRNEDIDKWAYAMSQDVSVAIKKDDAFWEGKHLQKDYIQLAETKRHNIQDEGIGWMNAQTGAASSQIAGMRLKAEFPDLYSGSQVAPGGRYSGQSTNQVWTVDPTEAANSKREEVHASIYNGVYSPTGLTSVLYKLPPNVATPDEVNKFTEFMNKYYNGGIEITKGKDGQWTNKGATNDQLKSFWKVARFLHDQTGINTDNVEGAHNAFMGYTANYIQKHTNNGAMDSQEAESLRGIYTGVKNNLDTYQKDENQRKNNLQTLLNSNNPAYRKYVVPDRDDNRLINKEDIEKGLTPIVAYDRSGNKVVITPEQQAAAYVSGNMEYKQYSEATGPVTEHVNMIRIGDNTFHQRIGPYRGAPTPLDHLVSSYGQSNDFRGNMRAISNKVVPGTEFYNAANNIVGNRFTYDIDDDKHQINRDRLKELVLPGNNTNMYVVGEGTEPVPGDPAIQSAVQNMLNNPDYKQYIGTSYNYHTKGFNGKQMAEIKVADELPKGAPGAYKDLMGKTILIEKSPNAAGTYVNQYPVSEDYSYHDLNKGRTVSSDPLENSTGMGAYSISPYPQYNPTHYTVTMNKKMMNNKTGKVEDNTATVSVPVSGTDPYKLQQDVRSILMSNGANYHQNQNILRSNINQQ